MSDAIFEFRNCLREITILDHDSVSVSRPCEVQNCDRMTIEHWELLMNSNDIGDVFLCEGHGNTYKMLQVRLIEDKYVIRDNHHSSH
jgi:hypothetical protein